MSPVYLQSVFGIATTVNNLSYVDRGGLDERLKYVLRTERHVAIHGDSKQGKSWLRENALPEDQTIKIQCLVESTPESILQSALGQLGIKAELRRTEGNEFGGTIDIAASGKLGAKFLGQLALDGGISGEGKKNTEKEFAPIGQTPADLSWVGRILADSGKRLVVEDFHYLSESHQRAFAYMMKALGEYGVYVLVVGIWPQDHLLTYYNGDLDGRVEDIHLAWSSEELEEVLRRGAKALNVTFTPQMQAALVADAYENVGLLQRLAEQLCLEVGITEALEENVTIDIGPELDRARESVAVGMKGRYSAFADNFVRGMRRMPQGLEVYRHLLQTVTEANDDVLLQGMDSAELLGQIGQHGASAIRPSDLTQALDRIERLQAKIGVKPPVLTYNGDSRKVFIGDRSFLYFRKYGKHQWPWSPGAPDITNDLAVELPLEFDD